MEKTLPNYIKAWLIAVRLPTILIPTIQVFVGTAVAALYAPQLNWLIAFYAWAVAVCITIGTNLINEAIDFKKGADTLNPSGRIKVIRAGMLSQSQVFWAGLLALAIACAIPFALEVDTWICFAIVLVSAACGYGYTGGPYPISYLGLSEIFIFIFYGGVCVMVPFYAQTYFINPAIILAAVQMGLLAIISNALNNFRDIEDDALVNKKTLAVRFGETFARYEILCLMLLPFILNIGWLFLGYAEAALMPLLLVPIAVFFIRTLLTLKPHQVVVRFFVLGVLIHFFFGVLLIAGFGLS